MPNPLNITLADAQRAELEDVRGHHPLPYTRERAAAILKIADGVSGREAGRHRLLRPHWPDTIYEWVRRYQAEGVAGLKIRPGRGRKPAFSPRYADKETAREALLHTIHQSPQDVGQKGSRWTLPSSIARSFPRRSLCQGYGINLLKFISLSYIGAPTNLVKKGEKGKWQG